MVSRIIIILLFLSQNISFAQVISDTLNRVNNNNKKEGYWICYLDSVLNPTEFKNAKYVGYNYFVDGKETPSNFRKEKFRNKDSIQITLDSSSSYLNGIKVLSGTVIYYEKNRTKDVTEYYKNGTPTIFIDHFFSKDDSATCEIIYFDSLYQNNKLSCLTYFIDKNTPLYKTHSIYDEKPKRTFLIDSVTFPKSNHFKIAYNRQTYNFLEIGFSKHFDKRYIYYLKGKRIESFDRLPFPGFSISCETNLQKNKKSKLIVPKVSLFYIFTFCKVEAGIANFYNPQISNNQKLFVGLGPSILGKVNILYKYYFNINNNNWPDLSKHSITISIF